MSNSRNIKPDMFSLTELFHGTLREISAIISYDAMWETKTKDHLFYELNRRGCITLTDRLCLNPLGKLVYCHQQMCLFVLDLLKGPTMSSPQTANGQVIGIILNS